jgi:thioesterase domain-containing protein
MILKVKFKPKPYKGDMFLFSAQNKKRPSIYPDICHDQDRNENIIKWRNNISGKLYIHEIPGNHTDIMNTPGVESIAYIINKHLLKD